MKSVAGNAFSTLATNTDFFCGLQAMKDQLCFQLTQALAIECDVHPVAAYFDFLSTHLFSQRCPKPTTSLAYTVMHMLALVITKRHELRDAVLLGTGMFLSPTEATVIRQKVAALFETFLHLAVESVPTDLIEVPYQVSGKKTPEVLIIKNKVGARQTNLTRPNFPTGALYRSIAV